MQTFDAVNPPPAPLPRLSVAVSSRSLFDLEDANLVFEREGLAAFRAMQTRLLNEPAAPGVAFPLVRKLLALNGVDPELPRPVDVAILSKNDPACGRRLIRSCAHYGLAVERGIFTGGGPRLPYLPLLGANLFLSADPEDAAEANAAGIPAACVGAGRAHASKGDAAIRLALDGDCVLFGPEAQRVYDRGGLAAFRAHENEKAAIPLDAGPLHGFLAALHALRSRPLFADRLRIALVTARGLESADRAMTTLDAWGIQIDDAFFLRGTPKADWVAAWGPDFFFDDAEANFLSAKDRVASGHVILRDAPARADGEAA